MKEYFVSSVPSAYCLFLDIDEANYELQERVRLFRGE